MLHHSPDHRMVRMLLLISIALFFPYPWTARATSPDWSTITNDFYPLSSATSENPVMTSQKVSDIGCLHVADPFLMRRHNDWFMAFEAAGNPGKICLAQSADGAHWHYLYVIISETFHLSFPCFFEDNGNYYIVPESASQQSVRLYRATGFPSTWAFQAVLLSGRDFADPSVFRYNGTWWMFVGNGGSSECWLYYSDTLDHGWHEHPMSPIVHGDRSRARPAGRTMVLADDRLYRLAQKCDIHYGEAVRAFAIDVLTRTSYAEHEIPQSPILRPGDEAWNGHGMHQCDPWWTGDHWLAAVDGFDNTRWTIGVYSTESTGGPEAAPDLPFGPDVGAPLRLSLEPNPFLDDVGVSWSAPEGGPPEGREEAEILITDATGRLIRHLGSHGNAGLLHWDGRDEDRRPVAAGSYFLMLRSGTRTARKSIVRLR